MRIVVSFFASVALLVLSLVSVYRHPWSLWLFIVLYVLILCLCAMAQKPQVYSWKIKDNE